jgi:ATP phosphoribosyltransferase regulatory subunit
VAGLPAGALEAVLASVARRRRLEGALRSALEGAGYREVAVPLLQPAETGADWEPAYRVLDQDGAVLSLRPDVTGPVARLCAVGDAGGPRPRRLWYQATIFRRVAGQPREISQAGAERIGGPSDPEARVAADLEILGLVADCLRAAGARRWLVALGHVGYARERLRAAGAPEEAVLEALRRRDLAEAAERAGSEAAAELGWQGSVGQALSGAVRGDGPAAAEWRMLLGALSRGPLAAAVVVEPGLVLPAPYYTGLVFEVVVAGAPRPVGDGGRYDGLLGRWGPPEPAVGFALDTELLLAALHGEAPGEEARRAWAAVQLRTEAQGAGRA